jgi:hypothetical protein
MNQPLGSPFRPNQPTYPRVSLSFLLMLVVLNTALCFILLIASRVPAIANVFNDLFGLPRLESGDNPDRRMHFAFLMLCYTAPLVSTMVIFFIHRAGVLIQSKRSVNDGSRQSPFDP